MDFSGVVLFTVESKGSLVDLRFAFLAEQGSTNLALYFFDNDSSAGNQAHADAAVRARAEGKKPKMQVETIGARASNPLSQRMTPAFNKLASTKGDKAVAKISKHVPAPRGTGGSGSFNVTLEIQTSKTSKIVLDVPFDGDPDTLAGQTFHGKGSLIADSKDPSADMPALINAVQP